MLVFTCFFIISQLAPQNKMGNNENFKSGYPATIWYQMEGFYHMISNNICFRKEMSNEKL